MLRYSKGPAPKVLTSWQATPNAGWDSLPAADKDKVREALLGDQGHLCAYCQRRIPTKAEPMKVEHWRPQSGGKDKLRWSNLLGVCLGGEGLPEGEQHCDTARGDAALFLHPVEEPFHPSPRDHLSYTPEGEVRPKDTPQKGAVQQDINVLKLNAARLRRERKIVFDELWRRLENAGWSQEALKDEHRAVRIQRGVRAVPQCEVARYYVERWARKRALPL